MFVLCRFQLAHVTAHTDTITDNSHPPTIGFSGGIGIVTTHHWQPSQDPCLATRALSVEKKEALTHPITQPMLGVWNGYHEWVLLPPKPGAVSDRYTKADSLRSR